MKQKFNVTGMTCSACSAQVEKAVNKLDAVRKAEMCIRDRSYMVYSSFRWLGLNPSISGMARETMPSFTFHSHNLPI